MQVKLVLNRKEALGTTGTHARAHSHRHLTERTDKGKGYIMQNGQTQREILSRTGRQGIRTFPPKIDQLIRR